MKHNSKDRNRYAIGLALLVTLSSTQCSFTKKKCCGYSGPIVSPAAIALYAKDHFIPKDMIDEWTQRYEANKAMIKNDRLMGADHVLGDSCSFNGHYVSLLLCNKNSIGIRVLHGMDPDYKVHIILVGINPDYSTLYIPKPGSNFMPVKGAKGLFGINNTDEEVIPSFDNVVGGVEFSQKP
jgi:hypothetical protein